MRGWLLDYKKGDEVWAVYDDRRYPHNDAKFIISKVSREYIHLYREGADHVKVKVDKRMASERLVPHATTGIGSGYSLYKSEEAFEEVKLLKSTLKEVESLIKDLGADSINIEQANKILIILKGSE